MKIDGRIYEYAKKQLAIEYNCSPGDFDGSKNLVTLAVNSPKKRHYNDEVPFFSMVTLGGNAVITAHECMHPWLKEYAENKKGHHLFEHNNLLKIDEELGGYGKKLWSTHHMFLSSGQAVPPAADVKTKWFELEEINQFYGLKQFPNAFCKEYDPKRPDVLAVAAYDRDKIIGMAGCSADTSELWQIGIDVDLSYGGRGIGTYLVTLLKNEVEKRGKIPFYGTSLSNIYSWKIALKSGFMPAWIEIGLMYEV